MADAQALGDELNGLLTTETRSLARHLNEATPYLSAATYRVWHDMQHMAHDSEAHAQRLSALLARFELPERPGMFAQDVAFYHFVTVESLLPHLIDEKRRQIAAYRRAIDHAAGQADVMAELQSLLQENQTQLDKLQEHQRALSGDSVAADAG